MKQVTKDLYAKVLEESREVMFWHKYHLFVIYEASDNGWMVDVYTNDDGMFLTADNQSLRFVDGGHSDYGCSPHDAIDFMMFVTEKEKV
jgi:hypothetical protein